MESYQREVFGTATDDQSVSRASFLLLHINGPCCITMAGMIGCETRLIESAKIEPFWGEVRNLHPLYELSLMSFNSENRLERTYFRLLQKRWWTLPGFRPA